MPRAHALLLALVLAVPTVAAALFPGGEAGADGPDVTIKRDAYGVPHVYADDAYSLFWGNGYAQAQDRLFQMDVLRHVGKGESARYLGPSQLEMDLATRRELYTDAERKIAFHALSADHKRMFQGFADGINAWIQETRDDPTKLSSEFYALGHLPEDWTPEDTIGLAQFLLDVFGAGSGGNELDNARLYLHLKAALGEAEARAAFADLFWMHDASTFTTVKAEDATYAATEGPMAWESIPEWQWALIEAAGRAVPFADGSLASLQETAQAHGFPGKFGSNALVVAPRHAASGGAMLLGGPQMGYYNPMVPYEVALHGAGFEALGMGVGGAPGVIIGRTPSYAWTVTSGSSDQVDVVAVKLAGPREYYVSGTSGPTKPMSCRIETHLGPPTAVDQRPPVLAVQEVCRTDLGPVFAIDPEGGYAFSRQRTHRGDEVRSGALWLTVSQAPNMTAFAKHMDSFRFEFNFHVADGAGNIGYFHFGANPDRSEACDPRFPRLAGACDWTAVRTGDDLPHVMNPKSGLIVNWNNKPALGWSGGDAREKWGPVHRAQLLNATVAKFLAADGKLDAADLDAINVEISTRSPFPPHLVPPLLDATAGSTNATVQAARAALEAWAAAGYPWTAEGATCAAADEPSTCFGKQGAAFTIYERFRDELQAAVFLDEFRDPANGHPHFVRMGFVPETSSDPHAADHGREDHKDNVIVNALAGRTAHAWCDDVQDAAVQSCEAILRRAFLRALDGLAAEYGGNVADWRQPAHTIKFVGLSGGPAWRIPMVNRPSFNHWYDFGTGEAGSVLPPGTDQSWAPLRFMEYQFTGDVGVGGPHKRDQLDLYTAFDWKPARMTPASWESVTHFG